MQSWWKLFSRTTSVSTIKSQVFLYVAVSDSACLYLNYFA